MQFIASNIIKKYIEYLTYQINKQYILKTNYFVICVIKV